MTQIETGQGRVSALSRLSQSIEQNRAIQPSAAIYPEPQTLSSRKVEKHLDDVRKGKGYLSKDVNKDIKNQHLNTSFDLADLDPKMARLYNSFSTAFSYSKSARYIAGVERGVKTFKKILATA
jgi:hypothetical protein